MSDTKNAITPSDLKNLGNVRGTEYVYPERMNQIHSMTNVMHATARLWGYSQIDGPTLQPVEFYSVKSSEELLEDGYYVSSGDRTYMLRPEITPTIAYMLADVEKQLTYPVRWYSDPQIYRNERPQSGRRRQFGQFNLDRFDLEPLSNEARALADAEVIGEAIDTLGKYGLTADDVVMRVNSRAVLERAFDLIEIEERTVRDQLLSVIDAKEKLPEDVFVKKSNDTGITEAQSQQLLNWLNISSLDEIKTSEVFSSIAQTAEYKELAMVLKFLSVQGFGDYAKYDPVIVRGLGYYTGTVFEAFDKQPERSMKRSILGGGRYDQFTQKFGGKLEVTGVGFGIGHVPLEAILKSRDLLDESSLPGPDYYIAVQEEPQDSRGERLADILRITKAIRDSGKSVIIDSSITGESESRLKKQMNTANKIDALTVLIFLNDKEAIAVKDLATGEQSEVTYDTFMRTIAEHSLTD